jgi:hypothetical protein
MITASQPHITAINPEWILEISGTGEKIAFTDQGMIKDTGHDFHSRQIETG